MPIRKNRRRSVITTPFPTIEEVRQELGVSKERAAGLCGLMDGIYLADAKNTVERAYLEGLRQGIRTA